MCRFYPTTLRYLKRKLETFPNRYPSNNTCFIAVFLFNRTTVLASLHNVVVSEIMP